ncbi:Gldg family protein [Pseudobacter ginsenosidimutans]|uniref:ABC-2 type transport system permease protein n=1 Tax=Pseudobacter ginsenosidimutans TaxID=661488 RepID=A0A4Q7MQP4_9BACT|nr:Gldg family protein [Pseudobacter ginsenosidimutans]RZS71056.1 ABC-2 type transport system permease protein [Pseudobacter ginsenosidimutans]
MKIILKIARAELKYLFYSPIAWFVVFIFYLTSAAIYCIGTEQFSTVQEVFKELQPGWDGFEGVGKELSAYIMIRLKKYIYLFIPLLTMGIINREISNGTIKLLYSSPVTTREIVLGKYLGMVIFNFILLFIFAVMLASLVMTVENAEYIWFLSILLGMFFLINTYAAIGLFISCLTSYQIVAAIITFTVLFFLSVISSYGQQYDIIRDLTWFLSIAGKAELMIYGLITSRDVIYFILVIILFIGFALIRMKSTQESKKWTVPASKYLLLTVVVVILGYFSSRPHAVLYADITKDKLNTIHPNVQETLKKMDGSMLTVTLYTNLLDRNAINGLPIMRNDYVWNIWEKYRRFYPNLQMKYEYYYDVRDKDSAYFRMYPGKSLEEIAAIEAKINRTPLSLFKKPDEIRKEIDLQPEGKFLIMQLEYKGKKEFLRTYREQPIWPTQSHFAAVFKKLASNEDMKIGFVTGHYERSAFDYAPRHFGEFMAAKWSRQSMINFGAEIDSVQLNSGPVPEDINLLVVADPRSAYTDLEQERVIDYIRKGRNAIIYVEPDKQFILEPILRSIGVSADKGMIVRPDPHEMPHIFENHLTSAGNYLADEQYMYNFQKYRKNGGKVQNEGASSLNYQETEGFRIEPILTMPGSENTWVENGKLALDSAAPDFNASEGDLRKSEYVLALKLSRKIGQREQRIIVCGDADALSGRRKSLSTTGVSFYSWGLANEYPVYANYPRPSDRYVKLTSKQAKLLSTVYLYLASAALLLVAIVLLVRRKRK